MLPELDDRTEQKNKREKKSQIEMLTSIIAEDSVERDIEVAKIGEELAKLEVGRENDVEDAAIGKELQKHQPQREHADVQQLSLQ